MTTRRSFFQDVALLSALVAALEEEGYAQPQNTKLSDFWDAYYEEAARDPDEVPRAGTADQVPDPTRQVQLIQGTPDGLRYTDTIDKNELIGDTEDVVVVLDASHFRAASVDHKAVAKSRGCQVQLDLTQTRPIMPLLAPVMWAGLAAWDYDKTAYVQAYRKDINGNKILDSHGKPIIDTTVKAGPALPALTDLDFKDPNAPGAPPRKQVILKGGTGRMGLNVRAVRQNDKLKAVLDNSVKYSSIVAPFFGFAPIAIPALKAFTQLLGAVYNHEAVILNTMPLQLVATQSALNGPRSSNLVKVVKGPGDYIAVPQSQAGLLKGQMNNLRVQSGYLVHKDTPTDQPLEERAADDKRLPDLTYVGMSIHVQSLADAVKEKAKG